MERAKKKGKIPVRGVVGPGFGGDASSPSVPKRHVSGGGLRLRMRKIDVVTYAAYLYYIYSPPCLVDAPF